MALNVISLSICTVSPTGIQLKSDYSRQYIKITNTTSTGQIKRYYSTQRVHFYIKSSSKRANLRQVLINNCVFEDSTVGVRIIDFARVYILNTNFCNIRVIKNIDELDDQPITNAAGLTVVSDIVNLENITFANI